MHDDGNCPYVGEYEQLAAENARLHTEVYRLKQERAAATITEAEIEETVAMFVEMTTPPPMPDDLPPTRLGVCPQCCAEYWGDGSRPCAICDPPR